MPGLPLHTPRPWASHHASWCNHRVKLDGLAALSLAALLQYVHHHNAQNGAQSRLATTPDARDIRCS
jgi:hypothetical protein